MREVEAGIKSEDVDCSVPGNERIDQISIVRSCISGQLGSFHFPAEVNRVAVKVFVWRVCSCPGVCPGVRVIW